MRQRLPRSLTRPAAVALALLAVACSSPNEGAVAELAELGYFDHTPPAALASVRTAVAGATFPFVDEASGRFYWADAETLAEGGVGELFARLAPTLEALGVDFGTVEEEFGEGYAIRFAGRRYVLWSESEAEEARALTAVRAFAIVNELLAAAGSDERLWAVGGDNDMVAVLLTPELARYFSERVAPEARPYLPRDEPPWYGMPHQ